MRKVGLFLASTLGHFWRLTALLLILCALLVQLGRMATPMVADYREPLVDYLSAKLGLVVAIDSLDARWESLLPILALEGLVISTPNGKVVLEVESALAEVDLIASALDQQLRFSDVEFLGVRSNFVENENGSFSLEGLSPSAQVSKDSAVTPYTLDNLRDIFLIGKQVNLIDLKTQVRLDSGHELAITVNRILLEHGNNRHRLSATIQLEDKPEAISLIMEGSGDPFDITEFGSKAYVRVDDFPTEKLLALLARRYWKGLPEGQWRSEGQASIEAWLTLTPDQGLNGQGKVKLSGLPFAFEGRQIPFRSMEAEIIGSANFNGDWSVQLQNTHMQWGETAHPPFALQIQSNAEQLLSVNADQIEMHYWREWISDSQILSPELNEILEQIDPQGRLDNLHVSWPFAEPQNFLLQANLVQVSAQAWRGAPAVTQVDGYLETRRTHGFVDLDSRQGFSMHYTSVYHNAMTYDAANGQVAWWIRPEEKTIYVNSGPIQLRGEDGNATGYLYINAPLDREDHTLELLLQIGIEQSAAKYHKKYVPFVVSENLRHWLDASVKAGDVRAGGFIFHGFISGTLARLPSVQLWLDLENAALDYMSPWPAISEVNAELVLDTAHLQVNAKKGTLYSSTLEQAQVELVTQNDGAQHLLIDGRLNGPLANGQQLLAESPLATITNNTFSTWQMDGHYRAELALNIPLSQDSQTLGFDVQVDIEEGELTIPSLNITGRKLNGSLGISDQKAVVIDSLRGELWDRPFDISSKLNKTKDTLALKLAASADIDDLVTWAGFPAIKQASGVSDYRIAIDVPWGAKNSSQAALKVTVASDLKGLILALPEPLEKGAAQAIPFELSIPLEQDKIEITARAGKFADVILRWTESEDAFQFDRGAVQLFGSARLPEQPMLRVGASFQNFDLSAWLNAFEGQWAAIREQPVGDSTSIETVEAESNGKVAEPLPFYLVLNTEHLLIDGQHDIGETHLEGIKGLDRWVFSLQNERMAGTLDLPLAAGSALDLSLKVLRLPLWSSFDEPNLEPATDLSAEQAEAESDKLALESAEKAWQRVKSLPRIHTAIAGLYVKEKNIGQLTFDSYVQDDTWHINHIAGSLFGLSVVGADGGASLSWNHGANQSIFLGKVQAGDLGAVMTAFETEKLIESNRATFNANLTWRGDPYTVNLEALRGDVEFQVKDGRFMRADASASNALMRLMGIFNFDTWIRRLQLDFSDVYASGMAYDDVNGALQFNRGLVQFNTPISVKTPSSKMQMEGQVDLIDNTIDTRLTVNLPVLDNLTFIAAVSAGLPVAAGVFVASRLFEKQFDKMTSVNYRVVGSLDNPTVQFKQVAESSKKRAAVSSGASEKPAGNSSNAVPKQEPSEVKHDKSPAIIEPPHPTSDD